LLAHGLAIKMLLTFSIREQSMSFARFVRNVGFAFAAGAVILGFGITFEYLPLVDSLAR
jgi:hypothetical protein